MISFSCPDCGKAFTVKDELAGKKGKCAGCGQTFRVPDYDPEDDLLNALPVDAPEGEPGLLAVALENDKRKAPAPETPRPKEYKVLAQRDKYFVGKFDPEKLQAALNALAQEGWTMKGIVSASIPGLLGPDRDEVIVILER